MKNKKGIEMSFGWIFAIIAGAVLIFLAIYSASKLIDSSKTIQDSQLGKQLGTILSPMETGLESGKISKIALPGETELFNDCDKNSGTFGAQKISVSSKSGFKDTQSPGAQSTFHNKYLFSSDSVKGKNYLAFSKPLKMPFKIGDLIYLWSENDNFCFVNPPKEIEDEINNLKIESINVTSSKCSKGTNICFVTSGCDIDVILDSSGEIRGSLKRKYSQRVYFSNSALFYGAVFSSVDTYECHVKRLLKRASELSLIYRQESELLGSRGCVSSTLSISLEAYSQKAFLANSSQDLLSLNYLNEQLAEVNNDLLCKLF